MGLDLGNNSYKQINDYLVKKNEVQKREQLLEGREV